MVGRLDLLSAFNSGVHVCDRQERVLCRGGFRPFSSKWVVTDGAGEDIGLLKAKFSLFSKRFEYESCRGAGFSIESPAFSREYDMLNASGIRVARFEKISGPFSAGAFRLVNYGSPLSTEELICVVMGVHAIQKRQQAQAGSM